MCNATRLEILAKTGFDFTFLAGAASQTIVVVPAIDVTAYHRAYLLVRLHAATLTAGQTVLFELDHTLPSDDDPAEFRYALQLLLLLHDNTASCRYDVDLRQYL